MINFYLSSPGFWLITGLVFGFAIYGWIQLALEGNLTWPVFGWTAAFVAFVYLSGLGIVTLAITAFV